MSHGRKRFVGLRLHSLRTFWDLSKAERKIVVLSSAALLCTRAGLFVFGFRRWQELLRGLHRNAPQHPGPGRAVDRARHVERLQKAAERHLFFRPSCLEHSLVLQWMLGRQRISGALKFGARKQNTGFEAHAWVEVDGVALEEVGGENGGFTRFEKSQAPDEARIH